MLEEVFKRLALGLSSNPSATVQDALVCTLLLCTFPPFLYKNKKTKEGSNVDPETLSHAGMSLLSPM